MTLPEPGRRPRLQPPQSLSSFTDAVLHVLFPGTLGARNSVPGHRPAPAAITSQTDHPTDHRHQYASLERCRAFAVTRTAVSPSLPAHSRCTDTPLYIPRNETRGSSTLALRKNFASSTRSPFPPGREEPRWEAYVGENSAMGGVCRLGGAMRGVCRRIFGLGTRSAGSTFLGTIWTVSTASLE